MIYWAWWALPDHLDPLLLLGTLGLSFPVYLGLVWRRRWSLLDDLLFVRPQIRKASITPETILYTFFFGVFLLKLLKRTVTAVYRRISSWSRNLGFSFSQDFIPFIVLLGPVLPVSDTLLHFLNLVMRVISAWSWHLFAQKVSVFMEVSFLTIA